MGEQANTMSGPTSTVMGGDLPLEKLEELQATVYMALEKGKHDQDAAKLIKEDIEKREKGAWHVIVGSSYGIEVTHETGSIIVLRASVPLPDAPYRRESWHQPLDQIPAASATLRVEPKCIGRMQKLFSSEVQQQRLSLEHGPARTAAVHCNDSVIYYVVVPGDVSGDVCHSADWRSASVPFAHQGQ